MESPEISSAKTCSSLTAGNGISSQPFPVGWPFASKWLPYPASANPITGTPWLGFCALSVISSTNDSIFVPVAASAFEIDSVDGQRARPSAVMRLDRLNVVGSSPALLASPEAERPQRAARRSRAVQICAWVSMSGNWVLAGPEIIILEDAAGSSNTGRAPATPVHAAQIAPVKPRFCAA